MISTDKLSRTAFLRLSAMAAASTVVAACASGSNTASSSTGSAASSSAAPASTSAATSSPAASSSLASSSSAAPTSSASASTAASTSSAASSLAASASTTASSAGSATMSAASTTGTSTASGSATGSAAAASNGMTPGLTFNGTLKEAPMLADMVKAGKLPAVKDRLPDNPYVVPHPWLTTGKYGGTIQMTVSDKSDWGTGHQIQEMMYGHSHLRWLKDGLAIGPGLVESFEANSDLSQWTLHFRKGLKWSDGQPFTMDDIMFWWEDEVGNPDLKQTPPDEMRSGKGTIGQLKAVDANTLQMIFDAPAPLTADRLAMWVKRGIGPIWMDPKHYLKQFLPKYNPSVDKKTYVDTFNNNREFAKNPACPTMTGWMLKQYNKGQSSVWTRNPYYWCIDKEGNQLPYLDGLTQTNIQDPQVMKLNISDGKIDYVHGAWGMVGLSDVSTIKQNSSKNNLQVWFWDSGSGTGSMYFFNYDFADPKMRALIRDPKFRHAMSIAVNRDNIQKAIYFNTGQQTSGTLSPKAIEYHTPPDGENIFKQWSTLAVQYDPAQAKQMLDSIGVKMNGQYRTMPDGSPLNITLDYPADQAQDSEHVRKNELVASDWQAIGINAKLNPVTPASFGEQWAAGKILTTTAWEVGDGPNHLVYPQWLVPMENSRWAPLEGQWYDLIGTPQASQQQDVDPYKRTPPRMKPDAGSPIDKIWTIYNQTKVEPDQMKRTQMVWDMIKVHISDGPFFSGTVGNPPQVVLVRNGLKNVPTRDDLGPKNGYQNGFTNPWIIPSPAVYDPETYYWDNPDQHK